jgi:hypothetical protein
MHFLNFVKALFSKFFHQSGEKALFLHKILHQNQECRFAEQFFIQHQVGNSSNQELIPCLSPLPAGFLWHL